MNTIERLEYRIDHAKAAMENIEPAYEILLCGADVEPEHDGYLAYQLGNFQDLITLHEQDIQDSYSWARFTPDELVEAYAQLIEEIRENKHKRDLEKILDECAQ